MRRRLAVRGMIAATAAVVCAGLALPVSATVIITQQGPADPTSQGFGLWPFNGGIAAAAVPDDSGTAAWQIANTGSSDEQAYYEQLGGTGPFAAGGSGLTAAEASAINSQGFTLTLDARVVNGPTYSTSGGDLLSVDATLAGFNGARYDISLGSDGHGNTLVILPTLINFNGGTSVSATPFGGAPLIIPGTAYHLYQLVFDPATQLASPYVDGVQSVTGYAGSGVTGGATANNYGLGFGVNNDATGNFALVQLSSGMSPTPLPGSAWMLCAGVAALALALRRRPIPARR